jgi:RNA polymerase sigma-70 factor (ECF subfamily)
VPPSPTFSLGSALEFVTCVPSARSSDRDVARTDPPAQGLEDFDCLERVRQGDEDAARALVTRLYPLVIKLVRSHLPRRTSEEDLAQTVFMKIFSKLDQFSRGVPLEHWVSRITINTCLNQIAGEKVRPELRWADLSEEEEHVVESLAATTEEMHPSEHLASRELLQKLLAHLQPADRTLIQLMYLEGKSLQELKTITGCNVPLIKVRLFRARQKLKKHLDHLMKESPR